MLGAKKVEFYQSIRRKQIDQLLKKQRKRICDPKQQSIDYEQDQEYIETIKHIMKQIQKSTINLDYYQIIQHFKQLKSILKVCSNFVVKNIAKPEYQILQKIVRILDFMLDSNLNAYQLQPLTHKAVSILNNLLTSSAITEDRLINCKIVPILTNIFKIYMNHSQHNISQLFVIFGNIICQSSILANSCLQYKTCNILFDLFISVNPQASSQVTRQFLFFCRCLLDQTKDAQIFDLKQSQICKTAFCESIYYYISQGFVDQQQICSLQDAIQNINKLIDLKLLKMRSKQIPYTQLIDLLPLNQCPSKIKKSILYLIDTIVVLDDHNLTQYLVNNEDLLIKIWGVDQELKHIVYNIFSNVALDASLKNKLQQFLTPIRLQIVYREHEQYLLVFLLNYLHSQNFQLKSRIEKSFVETLQNSPETFNKEIINIMAKIWMGLLFAGNQYIPPTYIFQYEDEIEEVQGIIHLLQVRGYD